MRLSEESFCPNSFTSRLIKSDVQLRLTRGRIPNFPLDAGPKSLTLSIVAIPRVHSKRASARTAKRLDMLLMINMGVIINQQGPTEHPHNVKCDFKPS